MRYVRILFVIFVLVGDFALFGDHKWVVAKDLRAAELTNSTAQREHELLIKSLSLGGLLTLFTALELEVFAKSIGNDFYGISAAEEGANRENNAIIKAEFECYSNLLTMDRKMEHDSKKYERGFELLVKGTGSLSEMISYYCSIIDEQLKDDACYATAKKKYQSQNLTSPKKTYMYGFPESYYDMRKAVADLFNDPQMRKYRVVQMFYLTFYTKNDVLKLAKQTGKWELVQKVFEKSIESLTPHLKDYKPDEIDLDDLPSRTLQKFSLDKIICETLRSNINEYPDLRTEYKSTGGC